MAKAHPWDEIIKLGVYLQGWGASSNGVTRGGPWTKEEADHHNNCLELLAGLFSLKLFVDERTVITVLLRMDNVTAIAFVNRMGGTHSEALSSLAIKLWEWCLRKKILVHAEHLPGKENIRADWGPNFCRTPATGC